MSLVKKPDMTPKRLAALARNRARSHGPAAAAGRERIRAANLRHPPIVPAPAPRFAQNQPKAQSIRAYRVAVSTSAGRPLTAM